MMNGGMTMGGGMVIAWITGILIIVLLVLVIAKLLRK